MTDFDAFLDACRQDDALPIQADERLSEHIDQLSRAEPQTEAPIPWTWLALVCALLLISHCAGPKERPGKAPKPVVKEVREQGRVQKRAQDTDSDKPTPPLLPHRVQR